MLTSYPYLLPLASRLVLLLATSTGFTTAQTMNALIPGRAHIFGKLLDDSGHAVPPMHVRR